MTTGRPRSGFAVSPTAKMVAELWCVLSLACVLTATGACAGPVADRPLDQSGIAVRKIYASVTDLSRTSAFYRALGFDVTEPAPLAPINAQALEVKGPFGGRYAVAQRDGYVIEFLELTAPRVVAQPSTGAAFQRGLAGIGLTVDDVDRVAAIVRAHGGSVVEATRTVLPGRPRVALFCRDPDGMQIELVGRVGKSPGMQKPGQP